MAIIERNRVVLEELVALLVDHESIEGEPLLTVLSKLDRHTSGRRRRDAATSSVNGKR